MSRSRVDYDTLAPTYNQRFVVSDRPAMAAALQSLATESSARRILEVGCGTGRWLEALHAAEFTVFGLDPSRGMLQQARQRPLPLRLVQGRGESLPYAAGAFEMVSCVNALHHMSDPRAFIREARRVLAPGGRLAIASMDPHDTRNVWYVYDFFEGVYASDLSRFQTHETVLRWLAEAGFVEVERRAIETIEAAWMGEAVLTDPFLQKHATSQLALLDEAAYAAGLQRLTAALAQDPTRRFRTVLHMEMLVGTVGGV